VTTTRLRNLALPIGLAVLAAVLVGVYVISYRNSVNHGAGMTNVLVASRDIPAGTNGAAVAAGGYLGTESVPRRAVVPGSIVSAAPLTSLVAGTTIYKGEQVTLRQFVPIAQSGDFAQFSGRERLVVVPGDPNQLLAGTVSAGDRVDVVANVRYHIGGFARSTARVVLENLLVLKAPAAPTAASGLGGSGSVGSSATLVMTDRQSQTMLWALENSQWFLTLRPTTDPRSSKATMETLHSFLAEGLSPNQADKLIQGGFPETPDGA
jgi:Flp pilus assembly protein CpaB